MQREHREPAGIAGDHDAGDVPLHDAPREGDEIGDLFHEGIALDDRAATRRELGGVRLQEVLPRRIVAIEDGAACEAERIGNVACEGSRLLVGHRDNAKHPARHPRDGARAGGRRDGDDRVLPLMGAVVVDRGGGDRRRALGVSHDADDARVVAECGRHFDGRGRGSRCTTHGEHRRTRHVAGIQLVQRDLYPSEDVDVALGRGEADRDADEAVSVPVRLSPPPFRHATAPPPSRATRTTGTTEAKASGRSFVLRSNK
jgi:hypothetical protein